jgi:predicted AAA+ superfamily ATPase
MYARIFNPETTSSYFLFGPRGIGKTSWLKENYPKAIYIDLLKSEVYNSLRVRGDRLWDLIPKSHKGPVIIDEIQKLPSLLDEIHSHMNEFRGKFQFIMTGSSARKLRKAGVNLLAGRARVQNFYPLLAQELGDDFKIRKALTTGMLPETWVFEDPQEYLESYLQVYIDQEVRLEGLVRNVDDFARFLEAASLSQATVLNISNVASDAGVPRKTVQTYFEILEDLLIAYRLPVFQKKAKRELIKHDKFYFFDVGLFQVIRPKGILDSTSEIGGAALETLVLTHIKAINDLKHLNYDIAYWHTKTHQEVDFVLYGERRLIAIEVKSSSQIRDKEIASLKEFHADYPKAQLLFVYGGATKKVGDIQFVAASDFLTNIEKWIG